MDERDARIKERIEPFDEAVDFDFQLVCADNGAMDGRVQSGGITPGGEDANTFHLNLVTGL
jgi:hypothetical protein